MEWSADSSMLLSRADDLPNALYIWDARQVNTHKHTHKHTHTQERERETHRRSDNVPFHARRRVKTDLGRVCGVSWYAGSWDYLRCCFN